MNGSLCLRFGHANTTSVSLVFSCLINTARPCQHLPLLKAFCMCYILSLFLWRKELIFTASVPHLTLYRRKESHGCVCPWPSMPPSIPLGSWGRTHSWWCYHEYPSSSLHNGWGRPQTRPRYLATTGKDTDSCTRKSQDGRFEPHRYVDPGTCMLSTIIWLQNWKYAGACACTAPLYHVTGYHSPSLEGSGLLHICAS